MKISLRNIGLIEKADVDINGITVIAGKNNTGKSTVAKSLYSVFKAFYNIDYKIKFDIKNNINEIVNLIVSSYSDGKKEKIYILEIIENMKNLQDKFEFTYQVTLIENNDNFKSLSDKEKEIWKEYKEKILKIFEIPNNKRKNKILNKYIDAEFKGQINNIHTKQEGCIDIKIRENTIKILSKNNNAIIDKEEISIKQEATYIENSYVLNTLNDIGYFLDDKYHDDDLALKITPHRLIEQTITKIAKILEKLNTKQQYIEPEQGKENISKEIMIKEKFEKLNKIVNGKLIHKGNNIIYQSENGYEFDIKNISSGLKTLIVIKQLLINNRIQEKDTLILDEPEIHLHPEWQLTLAEVIVLLQKEFNLHILLSTHSPYFLKAIEVYSKKHNISDKCKYYLTNDSDKNSIIIDDVTDETYEIYRLLAEPYNKLHEIERENITNEI